MCVSVVGYRIGYHGIALRGDRMPEERDPGGFFGSRQAWIIFLILILLLMGTGAGYSSVCRLDGRTLHLLAATSEVLDWRCRESRHMPGLTVTA